LDLNRPLDRVSLRIARHVINLCFFGATAPYKLNSLTHSFSTSNLTILGLLAAYVINIISRRVCYTASVTALYADTDPKIEQMQIDLIRRMPAWKKLKLIDDLYETLKTLAMNGIKQRHPNATEPRVRRMLADRLLGEELAAKVFSHAR